MAGQALIVDVYPAAASEARCYEDDGETREYLTGASLTRRFAQKRAGGAVSVSVGAAEGKWRPAPRPLRLRVAWSGGAPRRVLVGRQPLAASPGGWPVGPEGFVSVELPDRYDAFDVSIEP
jgi:hypothetical protein